MTLYNWSQNVEITVGFAFGEPVFPDDPPDAEWDTTDWTDVAAWCQGVSISRGRPSVQAHFDAGTATFTLDNTDGRFDPNNSSSPYYPDLRVGTPVRVTATAPPDTERHLFIGSVVRWPLAYPSDGHDAVVEVEAVDWTEVLNRTLITTTYPVQSSSDRINAILTDAGWPPTTRQIDVGTVTVDTVDYDNDALKAIHDTVDAEQGDFYINAAGAATFRNRVAYSGDTPLYTFGPLNIQYADVTLDYDKDFLINTAQVTASNDEVGTASDATSIAEHGPSFYQGANPALINGIQATNVAEWIVGRYKNITVRVSSLTVDADIDTPGPNNPAFAFLCALDLRKLVTVKVDPPGSGDPVDQDVFIEGIAHEITPESWVTTLQCYPASDFDTGGYWILDVSQLGITTITA